MEMTCEAVKSYEFKVSNNGQIVKSMNENVSMEVDTKVRQFMHDNAEKDYSVALHKVLDADPALKLKYARS